MTKRRMFHDIDAIGEVGQTPTIQGNMKVDESTSGGARERVTTLPGTGYNLFVENGNTVVFRFRGDRLGMDMGSTTGTHPSPNDYGGLSQDGLPRDPRIIAINEGNRKHYAGKGR